MKKVKSNISTVPPAHPGGKVTATQKANVGGSIVGFVLSGGYFLLRIAV